MSAILVTAWAKSVQMVNCVCYPFEHSVGPGILA